MLIILYAIGYWFRDRETPGLYYSYILWTLSAAAAAVLADNLLLLLVCWEVLTLLLYLLVNMGGEGHETAAQKA